MLTVKVYKRSLLLSFVIGVFICSTIIAIFAAVTHSNSAHKQNAYRIIPEYKRFLEKIVISLPIGDTSLELHHDILMSLPGYTQIIMLLPKSSLPTIEAELKKQPYGQRTVLVPFDTKTVSNDRVYMLFSEKDKLQYADNMNNRIVPSGTKWAQDLFEVATKPDGQTVLLISDIHKWFNSQGDKSSLNVVSDNAYLNSLSSVGMEIRRLPLTFDGGNILVDEFLGKRIVFIGGDVIRNTRTVWKSTRDLIPTDSQIIKMIKDLMIADKVVVIGRSKVQPPSLMFHLDQAMIVLADGVIGVTNIVGKSKNEILVPENIRGVDLFLSQLRTTLLGLGYKVVDIDTSVHNLLNHQHYVNAITYVDAKTGQKTILMPVFPSNQTHFERGLVKKNTTTFESLGYKVVHIPTKADKINGGIHCLINVIE